MILKCKRSEFGLTAGKTYKVQWREDDGAVHVINDEGSYRTFSSSYVKELFEVEERGGNQA